MDSGCDPPPHHGIASCDQMKPSKQRRSAARSSKRKAPPAPAPGRFLASYRTEIRFLVLFFVLFAAMQGIHYAALASGVFSGAPSLTAEVGVRIINFLSPSDSATLSGTVITGGGVKMNVVEGCKGTDGVILLCAALIAFPMPVRRKIAGFVIGSLIIYAANFLRVVALYFTLSRAPSLFEMMHIFVGQTYIVLITIIFFAAWIVLGVRGDAAGRSR